MVPKNIYNFIIWKALYNFETINNADVFYNSNSHPFPTTKLGDDSNRILNQNSPKKIHL